MKTGSIRDLGRGIKQTYLGVIEADLQYFGKKQKEIPLRADTKMSLAGIVLGGTLMLSTITGAIFGAAKGFDWYLKHESQPKIIYYHNGNPVKEKRFNTREQLEEHTQSNEHKSQLRLLE